MKDFATTRKLRNVINDTATKNNNNSQTNTLSTSDINNEQHQSHSINDENIEKQKPIMTKSTKTKMTARKGKGSVKGNITISPEIDLLSVMTTEINTATIQSFTHPEQFTAVEQDSTSSLRNEENDDERRKSEPTTVDVSTTEEIETAESELKLKPESLQLQDSDESRSDDSIKEQNDGNNDSEVDHNQEEIPLETNTTEMDDLIVKEADDDVDSDDISLAFLEALTTKEIMSVIEDTMPVTDESEMELKNVSILTTNQKRQCEKIVIYRKYLKPLI
ncbi:hypothetical protein DINM_002044 [Dirofilaria immitis]|nr:hypothetical protein [Dirofilaria immitis]